VGVERAEGHANRVAFLENERAVDREKNAKLLRKIRLTRNRNVRELLLLIGTQTLESRSLLQLIHSLPATF